MNRYKGCYGQYKENIMTKIEGTREELIKELRKLQKEYNSLKELYDKETSGLRKPEEKMSKSEEIYRKAYMTSPDSININRLSDGMYISINEGFTRILRYSEAETIGKTSLEMNIWANPDDRKKLVQILKEKGEVRNFEANFQAKDGTILNGIMSASIIDLDGVPHILNVTRDITNRKKDEEALAQEQYLMHTLMDNLPDHIYFKDRESHFIRINKSMARFLGLNDSDQAGGKTDFDFFTAEHAQQAYGDEQNIIKTGQLLSKEEKETHHDRPDTWVSTIKMPLRDKDGKIIGTFGISRDITEQKLAAEALRESEEHYSFLFHKALDGIGLADAETGIIIDCNDTLASLVGRKREELVGQSQKILHPPDNNNSKFSAEFEKHLADREGKSLESQIITSSGIVREVEIKANHLNINGRETLQGVFRDITERKKLEYDLLFKQILLEAIIENIPDQVYYKDKNSKFVLCNAPVAQLAGCSSEMELLGKSDFDFYPARLAQKYFNDEQAIMENGQKLLNYEEQIIDKRTGEIRWNLSSKVPVRDAAGKVIGLAGINRDITERKKTEEEIKLKNELLQTINAEKDKFFSILAHDLKGPLSAFLDATQILAEEIQNMTLAEIKEITFNMKESASNIYGLLVNLLEWSRLKRGMMDFHPETSNVKKKIITSIEVLTESARRKEIKISYSLPDDLEIYADSHMFETLIRNLVSNAIKFTPRSGEIHVSASVTPGNPVEIRVSDNGIGMSRELMSKLFMLNEKTNRKGTEDEPSTGLGLLLCKEFVDKHSGKIWAESEEGKGSTFCFSL
jgi:PAS domain S-box-containing protein